MTKHQFIQRIAQETHKMCRSLESCTTFEQLDGTRVWCDGVMNRWNIFVEDWRQKKIDKVSPLVQASTNQLSGMYQRMKDIICPEEKEEKEPKAKPPVVIKGFRIYDDDLE